MYDTLHARAFELKVPARKVNIGGQSSHISSVRLKCAPGTSGGVSGATFCVCVPVSWSHKIDSKSQKEDKRVFLCGYCVLVCVCVVLVVDG